MMLRFVDVCCLIEATYRNEQPMVLKTIFGWAMLGRYKPDQEQLSSLPAPVCHASASPSTDDLLQRFWEIEEVSSPASVHTPEEHVVVDHQVTLPKKLDAPLLGESHLQAVMEVQLSRGHECHTSRATQTIPMRGYHR